MLGRASRTVLDGMAATIRSWGNFREELKEAVVKLLAEEAAAVAPT